MTSLDCFETELKIRQKNPFDDENENVFNQRDGILKKKFDEI